MDVMAGRVMAGHCFTGKRRYLSKLEAFQALTRCKKLGRPEKDFYMCKHCRCFHLTSQDPGTIGMRWTDAS